MSYLSNEGDSLKKPCIEYDCKFERSKLERIKLRQDYDDDSHREKKALVFTNEGIEGLFYVEDAFRKVARQLAFEDLQLFDQWEEVLQDNASEKWDTQTAAIPEANKTTARFNMEMSAFYLKYCGDDARDTEVEYLSNIKKQKKTDPHEFSDQMETLYRYANRLPGSATRVNADDTKKRIFKGFSASHQKHYLRSRDINADTLQEMVQFMENEKSFADSDDRKRKSESDGGPVAKRIKGGGKDNKGRKNKPKPHDPCPFHHGHKWLDCFDNPDGRNFKSRNSYGGGCGGGRFNNYGGRGGRGGFQGRGGRGNDRYNNNRYQGGRFQNRNDYQGRGNGNNGGRGGQNGNSYYGNLPPYPAHGAPQQPQGQPPVMEVHHFDQIGWGNGHRSVGNYGNHQGQPGRW